MDPLNTYADLWESDELADVTFMVGLEPVIWRIAAHKLVLSKCNSVFYDLFYGKNEPSSFQTEERPEKTTETTSEVPSSISQEATEEFQTKDNEIYIPITRPDIFDQLLRFLYLHDIKIDSIESAIVLHQAAHSYQIKEIVIKCIKYLEEHVTPKNLFQIYSYMEEYMEEEESLALHVKCAQLIDEETDEVLKTNGFLNLTPECVNDISSRNSLQLSSEMVLLDALLRWSLSECKRRQIGLNTENQRLVLGNVLFNVRVGLLSGDDLAELFNRKLLIKEDRKKFNSMPRINGGFTASFSVPTTFISKTNCSYNYSFISDRKIFLTSIVMTDVDVAIFPADYSKVNSYANHEISHRISKIEVFNLVQKERNILQFRDVSLSEFQNINSCGKLIELPQSVCIEPKKTYTVCMQVLMEEISSRNVDNEEIKSLTLWNDGRRECKIKCKPLLQNDSAGFGQMFKLLFRLPIRDDQNASYLDKGRELWLVLKSKLQLTGESIKQQWKKTFT